MPNEKFTKIVATVGPSSSEEHIIKELLLAGVNVFRFNTKHNVNDWHKTKILLVRRIAEELGLSIGILVDLQGPEIRIETYQGVPVVAKKNHELAFINSFDKLPKGVDLDKCIRIPEKEVFGVLKPGDKFSIDDGYIDFEVTEAHPGYLLAKAKEDAEIKTRKGLNLVGLDVPLPSLTDTDKERLSMASETNADFIALSFVRSKKDIEILRQAMEHHKVNAKIVAKIESQMGVDNIEEILESCDAIMVARGDLGIEIPFERVTHIQKELIKKCRSMDKPVIVATQMLESMITNARPTRAEAADIANAVYDETDCIMLSGETASGKYPIKAVETMRRIAKYNESHKVVSAHKPKIIEQTHLIVSAAMTIINEKCADRINKVIVFTETGYTARILSSFRPNIPVIAISESHKTINELTMSFGVFPIYMKLDKEDLLYPSNIIKRLKTVELVTEGETLLIIHGHKYHIPGSTNALAMLKV